MNSTQKLCVDLERDDRILDGVVKETAQGHTAPRLADDGAVARAKWTDLSISQIGILMAQRG